LEWGDGWHNIGDGGGVLGGFDGCVIAVDDAKLVLVGVAEESASDGIVEAVYDRVPGAKLEASCGAEGSELLGLTILAKPRQMSDLPEIRWCW
jgi:hypothetical protein